jgi:GH15 family glucan-1,4-alpha-glucosidase
MHGYPPIADHGLIGDLQSCALVSSEGVIDWFCAPRFDSPGLFARLLDHERGGHFSITAHVDDPADLTIRQLYFPDTAVVVTRFLTAQGIGEVVDFMPLDSTVDPTQAHDTRRIVRIIRVVRGSVSFRLRCRPRFDFGRAGHSAEAGPTALTFRASGATAHLQTIGPIEPVVADSDVTANFTLHQDDFAAAVLTTGPAGHTAPPPVTRQDLLHQLDATLEYWQDWISRCRYSGRWQQAVNRSAITLKLLTYAPTGAIVAAATAGLPEQIGGERNWDYRYTWVRDAALSVQTLLRLGYTDEALAFRRWLADRVRAGSAPDGEPLRVMYRVDGDTQLDEEVLEHFEGYRGSAPVRTGNGAAGQLQLDIYGEAVSGLTAAEGGLDAHVGYDGWMLVAGLMDWLCDHWDRSDEGVWETRGGRRNFTNSRLMCWVAFDRAIRASVRLARPADLPRWTETRDRILRQIMERGWSRRRGAFVQSYEEEILDAALLRMPLTGLIGPSDPRWLSTLDAVGEELVSDSLVHRYDPAASPDGLRGREGTFSLCTFLYVSALARAGRLSEARYAFDKMLTYANHVGLFAEEIGPAGEQLGNFPQAFTHLSLVTAAMALDEELDRSG